MCRPCFNTAHVYTEDDMLALDVRSQCRHSVTLIGLHDLIFKDLHPE
jgi:hypothetical protein